MKKTKFQEFIPIDGVVFPKNTFYIDAIQGGVVEALYAEDGDLVKKGDTLLKLLNTAMELSYMEQETRMLAEINNLQNTRLSLEQNKFIRQKEIVQLEYEIDGAERDFKRKVQLHGNSVISDKEFEDAEREFTFTVKQLEISLKLQRLDSLSRETQKRDIERSLNRMHETLALLRKNIDNAYVRAPSWITMENYTNCLSKKLYIDALYEWKGSNMYPDANSTIRFTSGPVKGYVPTDAVWYNPFTTLSGVIWKDKDTEPFDAPDKLVELYKKKDFGNYIDPDLNDVPVAFLHQTDITGGNSGSPVMNAKGESIGV